MIQKSCQIFSDTVVKNTKMYSITVKIYSSSQQSLKNNFFEISDSDFRGLLKEVNFSSTSYS
jgi:hypothetical protein